MYLKRQRSILSSCPLAIWRKSYSSNLCPKYASKTVFSGSKCKFSLPWDGGTPTWSLRSLAVLFADYFRRHGNIGHFQRRSLIMMMNISEKACLMLVFFSAYCRYIIVPYHAQTLPARSLRSLTYYFRRH